MLGSIDGPELFFIIPVAFLVWIAYHVIKGADAKDAKAAAPRPAPVAVAAPVSPTAAEGMKRCPFCAEEIQHAAIVCRFCQANLATNTPRANVVVVQQPTWNRGVAAVLSLVIPGAGQMYKGQVLNGIVWLVVVVGGYVAFVVPGILLHLCCIAGAASGKNGS